MKSRKQEKEAGTNFVLLSQPRNMTGRFMKTYLHRPINILEFLTFGRIQKYLTLKCFSFLSNAPSRIKQGIFLHVIPVRIIVPCAELGNFNEILNLIVKSLNLLRSKCT